MHPNIQAITQRIIERSKDTRRAYLDGVAAAQNATPPRDSLSAGNKAHACRLSGA